MFDRLLRPSPTSSFFLFGARGTGKSTLLRQRLPESVALWIDLLDLDEEARLARRPMALSERLRALEARTEVEWVVIDEVQKLPELLNVVHREIERGRFKFAMTGSSARKLRRGAANLLAGRAFTYHLFPLTYRELGAAFELHRVLRFGSLPRTFQLEEEADMIEFLRAYASTYLREEVLAEQLVRKAPPFRAFLEVAAQCSGQILNMSAIARDVVSDPVTVRTYFDVLVDTLLGFFLEPYHRSVRKRQRQAPKFYFVDLGIRNALARQLDVPILPRTHAFGDAFEHLVVAEIVRLASYARRDWAFSYLRTKDGAEIDLVVDRPGQAEACIEIKSTTDVDPIEVRRLARIAGDIPGAELLYLSLDPIERHIEGVRCLYWTDGIAALGI